MCGQCHEAWKVLLQGSINIIVFVRRELKILLKLVHTMREIGIEVQDETHLEKILLVAQRFVFLVTKFRQRVVESIKVSQLEAYVSSSSNLLEVDRITNTPYGLVSLLSS